MALSQRIRYCQMHLDRNNVPIAMNQTNQMANSVLNVRSISSYDAYEDTVNNKQEKEDAITMLWDSACSSF